jgi:alpha-tubulin suppressor-like RCC1 family protein
MPRSFPLILALASLGALHTLVSAQSISVQPDSVQPNLGRVWAWGSNQYEQLGNTSTSDSLTPVPVAGISGALTVAAGEGHSLALINNGTVASWGWNAFGQLGIGFIGGEIAFPRTVGDPSNPLSGVLAISAGARHSLALLADGTVRAWGWNAYGQLGDGTKIDSRIPVPVFGVSGAIAIAGGYAHSLALLADGTVRAWGSNAFGQLGNGTTVDSRVPIPVLGLSRVVAIAAGAYHSLALLSDGTVRAWGRNDQGQLGSGTTSPFRAIPLLVTGLPPVTAIAAGDNHNVAILFDGTVRAWGANSSGQLGNGAGADSATPVRVNLFGPVVISASSHNLALLPASTLWAWGANQQGQLGIGSRANSAAPVTVAGLSGVSSFAAARGGAHSLAVVQPGGTVAFLIQTVNAFVSQGILNPAQGASLNGKLQTAGSLIRTGGGRAAQPLLVAFVNEVNGLVSSRVLTRAQGQLLIGAANATLAQI